MTARKPEQKQTNIKPNIILNPTKKVVGNDRCVIVNS